MANYLSIREKQQKKGNQDLVEEEMMKTLNIHREIQYQL